MDCKFEMKSLAFVPSARACVVKNLTITSPSDTITSISNHNTNKTEETIRQQNIKVIWIQNQSVKGVHYIPNGLDYFFPNLEGIFIMNSRLKKIERSDLKAFWNLKQLTLFDNDLETLDSDLFVNNTNLRYVNFGLNKLRVVGENIFKPTAKIEQAYFHRNTCIDREASYKELMIRLVIDLKEQCSIKNIPRDYQAEAKKLRMENSDLKSQLKALQTKFATVNGNLDSATKNLFAATTNIRKCQELNTRFDWKLVEPDLIELKLKTKDGEKFEAVELKIDSPETTITRVKSEVGKVVKVENLMKLIVDEQQTLFLPQGLAVHFPRLMDLAVTNSGLFDIHKNVFRNLSLRTLNLSHNKLRAILLNTFADLIDLFILDLSFNRIQALEHGAFNGVVKLSILKLNDNLLVKIDGNIFDRLDNLKVLDLQRNRLKLIDVKLLRLASLEDLDLRDNICINQKLPNSSLVVIKTSLVENCSGITV